jgi:hypothetical protein
LIFLYQMHRDFVLGRFAISICMQQLRRLRRANFGQTATHHAALRICQAH